MPLDIRGISFFLSYSSRDQDFAERLYADLQAHGVRCWFAPHDLQIGDKFWHCIDEAIRMYDKLLVIISSHSIRIAWVENEVMAALEKENQHNKLMLFPIRLDEAVIQPPFPWAASMRRSHHIGDFSNWKDHDAYQKAFTRLLRDLQGKNHRDSRAHRELFLQEIDLSTSYPHALRVRRQR